MKTVNVNTPDNMSSPRSKWAERRKTKVRQKKLRKLERRGFPISTLPKVVREFILAMHEAINTPIEMCAQAVLAAMAFAAQGHANIKLPGAGIKVLSLYFLTIAFSGERKTPCDNAAMAAVAACEQALYAKAEDGELVLPLFVTDPTIEGLDSLFNQGAVSLAIFNDEGGQVVCGRSALDENKMGLITGLSKRWDGSPIKRVRKTDGVWWSLGKRLCCHLMIQPFLASTLLADPTWKAQGTLARFLIIAPPSMAGFRTEVTEWTKKGLKAKALFDSRMKELLELPLPFMEGRADALEPPVIELSAEADRLWRSFYREVERERGPGCRLENIREFSAKLAEHCGRLAGVLTVFELGSRATVGKRQMQAAIEISRFYLEENLRIYDRARAEIALAPIEELGAWLAEREGQVVTMAEMQQFGPHSLRRIKVLRPLVENLLATRRLVPVAGGAVWGGKRRREAYEVMAVARGKAA